MSFSLAALPGIYYIKFLFTKTECTAFESEDLVQKRQLFFEDQKSNLTNSSNSNKLSELAKTLLFSTECEFTVLTYLT